MIQAPGSRRVVLLALFGLVAASASRATTCADDAGYRALDPWLGEWRIVAEADGEARELGTTTLRTIVAGCAIEETRRLLDGSQQRGFGVLDGASGRWQQYWVTSAGDTGQFEVMPEGDTLRIRGTLLLVDSGQEVEVRSMISPRPGGGFDERVEVSADGGRTFEPQPETAYLPLAAPWADTAAPPPAPAPVKPAAPAPSAQTTSAQATPTQAPPTQAPPSPPEADPTRQEAAAEPAPGPSPAGDSGVRLRSGRKVDAPQADTAMESPMTVEFELGPLDALPAGASWRTEELAPYVVDGVSIPMITAGSHSRRGRVELDLTINLLTRAAKSKVDLELELLSAGSPVASARGESIALGKLIRSHDPKSGRPYDLGFELEAAAFAELFSDGQRPTIRLTLTVR